MIILQQPDSDVYYLHNDAKYFETIASGDADDFSFCQRAWLAIKFMKGLEFEGVHR